MALDSVNHRMFIPASGNGGYRVFLLNEDGTARSRAATSIIGRESIYGRRMVVAPNEHGHESFPGTNAVIDNSTQRMFSMDRFNNRIVVYDINPETLKPYPKARRIIGQPDFSSTLRGTSANRMRMAASSAIDEDGQRLFVVDPPNHRVLVFDVHPDRLQNDPDALAVIGQPDFNSSESGTGPDSFSTPRSVAYDPRFQRLFVADNGNRRVLIFDVRPDSPDRYKRAVAVMGQKDFTSREPRQSLDELEPPGISYDFHGLAYDWRFHRLFITEDLNHRVMVFDAHPQRIGYPTKAIAVIGQADADSIHPAVSRERLAMPRINIDPGKQKLYISEGFPAGNRISIWDISPENLKTGMPAVDVFGHETPDGEPDFNNRMAQGHLDGRSLAAARAVVLDPLDHRLFIGDQYNHRVVVYQLDTLNRFIKREASWVLGQPDMQTSLFHPPDARNFTVPLAVAYDTVTKRLFVGDSYHNRVLVFDAAPDQLRDGMAASTVIGQRDFQSTVKTAGRAGINFNARMGRGIGSYILPMGLAVDEAGQRLFLSDAANNRILIYDIRREHLDNGPEAIGVIGQDDFETTVPQPGARGLHDPGHLAFDPLHQRLFAIDARRKRILAFNVGPETFTNGPEAVAVLGQPDFSTDEPAAAGGLAAGAPSAQQPAIDGRTLYNPSGLQYDPLKMQLYVSDAGEDRILVFDAAPGQMQNGAAAVAVLGAESAETPRARYYGGKSNYPGQFTIRDTRGIALDPEYGRLFATGSFESRLVAFYFPRANWPYEIHRGGIQSFATLDAVDPGGRRDLQSVGAMLLRDSGPGDPLATSLYSVTAPMLDQRTQRHSRLLVSEAAVQVPAAGREMTFLIDAAKQRSHKVYVYNPSGREAGLTLTLRGTDGDVISNNDYNLAAGRQLALGPEELDIAGIQGPLTGRIESTVAVVYSGFRETVNSRGEILLASLPMVTEEDAGDESRIVPLFVNGGNKRSELVLINPYAETLKGTVTFYDDKGRRTNPGTRSDFISYHILSYSSQVIGSDGAGPETVRGYALLDTDSGRSPQSRVLVHTRYGDVWSNETLISGNYGREVRYAIDMEPTPVRHGLMNVELNVVNVNPGQATLRLTVDGQEHTLTLAPGELIGIGLKEVFGQNIQGLLEIIADKPLMVTTLQQTLNLRAELIETGLPALSTAKAVPYVVNGDGRSTEIRLTNLAADTATGQLQFYRQDGSPAVETILR